MKKIVLSMFLLGLVAAGCNTKQQVGVPNNPIQKAGDKVVLNELDKARIENRDKQRMTDVSGLRVAIFVYSQEHNGALPADQAALAGALVPSYISTLAQDPLTGEEYKYATKGGSSYYLQFKTEGTTSLGGAGKYCTDIQAQGFYSCEGQ